MISLIRIFNRYKVGIQNMDDIYIKEDKTILDAMKQLDKNAKKVLFVHENGRLLASVTDGDIRRWMLKKGICSFR